MQEKILTKKKNGMFVLFLTTALMLGATALFVFGAIRIDNGNEDALAIASMVIGGLWWFVGWIPYMGLKILKPQEGLVLTLFGKYIGTLKGDGFYYVNPFCQGFNPAAKTKLNQSGDVHVDKDVTAGFKVNANGTVTYNAVNNKISLKIMTLNNSRQKINDCLGNPVDIGIAVMWRVVDTAKAVFNVDNYKEYLSL